MADPAAEMPLALLVLGAGEVHLRTARKRENSRPNEFFTGMMSTARSADE